MGGTRLAWFKNIFENTFSLTGVESGFFADSANTYQDLSFELLKLNLCANAVFWSQVEKATLKSMSN